MTTTMTVKQLTSKIDALGKLNAKVEATIQELGIACLLQVEEHNNTDPLNRLWGVLRRTQHQAFMEWALAFGKVRKQPDVTKAETQAFAFDKTKTTDIEAAEAKPWFMFGDDKVDAVKKAFDFQQAVKSLLKKAAAAGYDHRKLVEVAAIAGIPADKVPASVVPVTAEEAPL